MYIVAACSRAYVRNDDVRIIAAHTLLRRRIAPSWLSAKFAPNCSYPSSEFFPVEVVDVVERYSYLSTVDLLVKLMRIDVLQRFHFESRAIYTRS